MTGDLTPAVALVASAVVIPAPRGIRLGIGSVGLVLLVGVPLTVVGAALVLGWWAWRRAITRTEAATDGAEAELLAVDLIALGVGGGLSFTQAAAFAAAAVGDPVRLQLEAHLRRLHVGAPHVAAGRRHGPDGGPIDEAFSVARRSGTSGSSLAPALRAVAETARRERAAAERRRLARLPTTLLFPLAFLILPGFVLMTVAPAIVSGLSRLSL